jgi:hypothetical protein
MKVVPAGGTVDEQNQIDIPQSFMALYSQNGRPTESRRTIETRYDLCEDLAVQTSDVCMTLQFKDDLPEAEVLRRCRDGLAQSGAASEVEAGWIVTRVAELLHWPRPDAEGPPAGRR